jgi:hypothetical protein
MNEVPRGRGVFVIFNEAEKTFEVQEADDIVEALRQRWWKHSFWYFSWFQTIPIEYCRELKYKLESMSYDEMWNFEV